MVIGIDRRWDRQILLILPIEYFPDLLFSLSIRLSGPSTLRYRHLSVGEYCTNEKDNIGVFPGKLVDLTVWSRFGSNPTPRLTWIWILFLVHKPLKDTRIYPSRP